MENVKRSRPASSGALNQPRRRSRDQRSSRASRSTATRSMSGIRPKAWARPHESRRVPLCDLIFIDGGHSYETVRSRIGQYCTRAPFDSGFGDLLRARLPALGRRQASRRDFDRAHWNVAILEFRRHVRYGLADRATSKLARVDLPQRLRPADARASSRRATSRSKIQVSLSEPTSKQPPCCAHDENSGRAEALCAVRRSPQLQAPRRAPRPPLPKQPRTLPMVLAAALPNSYTGLPPS